MATGNQQNRNVEGRALLTALHELPPDAATACAGCRVHDIAAHLAAGTAEIADLVEAKLEGRPDRPTPGFEERESPFRAMPYRDVLERLAAENKRRLAAYDTLSSRDDQSFAFTGAAVDPARLTVHSRSEAAIHRWDMTGDDAVSRELLAQPELTTHAVWVLNAMPVLQESAKSLGSRAVLSGHSDLTVAYRAGGQPDVVLHVGAPMAWMETAHSAAGPDVTVRLRPDHRLLVIWGRRPAGLEWEIDGDPELGDALDGIFLPRAAPWPPV